MLYLFPLRKVYFSFFLFFSFRRRNRQGKEKYKLYFSLFSFFLKLHRIGCIFLFFFSVLIRFMWETFPVCYIHQHIDEIYVVYKCNLHLLQRKFVNHLRKHFSEIFQKRSYLIFRTYNIIDFHLYLKKVTGFFCRG